MSDYDVLIAARNVIKRWWLMIIVFSICVAIGFCGYKEIEGNYVVQSDDILIGRQIQLSDYIDRQDRLQFDKLDTSGTLLYDFYKTSETQFDYEKMLPGWENKSNLEKIKWLKKHLVVHDYGAGNIEFRFDLLKSDAKDLNYVKANGEKYLDSYIAFLQEKKIIGDYAVKNQMTVFPESEIINKKGILIKYGIVGFILGAVLTFTILFIKELRK